MQLPGSWPRWWKAGLAFAAALPSAVAERADRKRPHKALGAGAGGDADSDGPLQLGAGGSGIGRAGSMTEVGTEGLSNSMYNEGDVIGRFQLEKLLDRSPLAGASPDPLVEGWQVTTLEDQQAQKAANEGQPAQLYLPKGTKVVLNLLLSSKGYVTPSSSKKEEEDSKEDSKTLVLVAAMARVCKEAQHVQIKARRGEEGVITGITGFPSRLPQCFGTNAGWPDENNEPYYQITEDLGEGSVLLPPQVEVEQALIIIKQVVQGLWELFQAGIDENIKLDLDDIVLNKVDGSVYVHLLDWVGVDPHGLDKFILQVFTGQKPWMFVKEVYPEVLKYFTGEKASINAETKTYLDKEFKDWTTDKDSIQARISEHPGFLEKGISAEELHAQMLFLDFPPKRKGQEAGMDLDAMNRGIFTARRWIELAAGMCMDDPCSQLRYPKLAALMKYEQLFALFYGPKDVDDAGDLKTPNAGDLRYADVLYYMNEKGEGVDNYPQWEKLVKPYANGESPEL